MGQVIIQVPQEIEQVFTLNNPDCIADVFQQIVEVFEDAEDILDARIALAEPGDNISLEQIKAELSL